MIKWLLLIAAILMVGCNSTDSKSDPILSGTYQHIDIESDGRVLTQWIFTGGNTYEGKIYIALNDGSAACLIEDGAGKWTLENNALTLTDPKARSRFDCNSAFSDWVTRPSISDPIRNLTASRFEMYNAPNDNSPAQWLTFVKL